MSTSSPTVAVIIAAAGSSTRMGTGVDKQFVPIGGHPLLWHSIHRFGLLPEVKQMLVTVSSSNEESVRKLLNDTLQEIPCQVVRGGTERQHSVRNALLLVDEAIDIVVVHDGARPFAELEAIRRSTEIAMKYGAAVVAVPVKDTIKVADAEAIVQKTLDRSALWQIQTPQTFRRELLVTAHEQAAQAGILATDDAALVERMGGSVHLVKGSYNNFKVTTPEDVVMAEALAAGDRLPNRQRVGIGYDVHRFIAGRPLMLGGVSVPYTLGLDGHSDADVLLHAISDALLGAAGLGDIGQHFPDTDPRYKGISSLVLLREVRDKLAEAGFGIHNVDAIVEAQEPKLHPFISSMNAQIAEALDIEVVYVNVKATTTEKLGFVGRKEGIAAQAVVMIG